MNLHDLMRELREDDGGKIVLIVADGLGGLPLEPGGKTELETARTPNLDALAKRGRTSFTAWSGRKCWARSSAAAVQSSLAGTISDRYW